jgi:hypothetical protein
MITADQVTFIVIVVDHFERSQQRVEQERTHSVHHCKL